MPKINFSEVGDQPSYEPLPAGRYTLQLDEVTEGSIANGKNAGKTRYSAKYIVVDNDNEKYNGRQVYENYFLMESTLFRIKAALQAFGVDVPEDDELEFEWDEVLGYKLDADLKITPARQDKVTGKEYTARNEIKQYIIPGQK